MPNPSDRALQDRVRPVLAVEAGLGRDIHDAADAALEVRADGGVVGVAAIGVNPHQFQQGVREGQLAWVPWADVTAAGIAWSVIGMVVEASRRLPDHDRGAWLGVAVAMGFSASGVSQQVLLD